MSWKRCRVKSSRERCKREEKNVRAVELRKKVERGNSLSRKKAKGRRGESLDGGGRSNDKKRWRKR